MYYYYLWWWWVLLTFALYTTTTLLPSGDEWVVRRRRRRELYKQCTSDVPQEVGGRKHNIKRTDKYRCGLFVVLLAGSLVVVATVVCECAPLKYGSM